MDWLINTQFLIKGRVFITDQEGAASLTKKALLTDLTDRRETNAKDHGKRIR